MPPLWLLLATHPGMLARLPFLSWVGPQKPSPIALPLQFLLAEFSIDILRRAVLNSAAALATSFGILGAVVIGQVSTKVNLFSPETLVYMVAAAISSFAISNLELGMATRMVRVTLVVLEWVMSLPGLVLGLVFWLVMLARTDSLGRSYLWPLYPFNWPALRSVLIREPVTGRVRRPAMLEPQNQWRSAH
jgi:stage V sporulation protein AF